MSDSELFESVLDILRDEDRQRISGGYMKYPIYKPLTEEERNILGYSLLHDTLFRLEWNCTTLFNTMSNAIMKDLSNAINFPKLVKIFMRVYINNIPDTKDLMKELKEQN